MQRCASRHTTANDQVGGLLPAFRQYDANFGVTVPAASGNGLLYSLAPTLSGVLTGSANRVYDGTVAAPVGGMGYGFTGTLGTDAINVSGAPTSVTFTDKNVGSGKLVSVAGLSVSSVDQGSGIPVFGYRFAGTASGSVGNIAPASLAVAGLTAASRVYDGGITATISGVPTVVPLGSDAVAVGGSGSGSFGDKNVGNNKPVTVTGLSLAGADAGNYTLLAPAGLQASITPAPLVVTGMAAAGKVYDTGTAAQVTGLLSGVIGNDLVNAGFSGQFASASVVLSHRGRHLRSVDAIARSPAISAASANPATLWPARTSSAKGQRRVSPDPPDPAAPRER